jgi:hypothetical protein
VKKVAIKRVFCRLPYRVSSAEIAFPGLGNSWCLQAYVMVVPSGLTEITNQFCLYLTWEYYF